MNFKEILKAIFFKILRLLISLSCRLNYPKLTGFLLLISLRRSKLIRQSKGAKKNIIVIDKSFGGDDLVEAFKNKASPYKIYIIQRVFIREIYNYFFRKYLNIIHENNYENNKDKNIKVAKLNYKNYLRDTFFNLNKYKKINALISFNIFYLIERELHFAAKELKIKFIVHMKESVHWKKKLQTNLVHWKNTFKKIPIYKMSVYNNYTKNIISKANLVPNSKIFTVGMPRADYYYQFKNKNLKKHVLYLMVEETAGLPYYNKEWRGIGSKFNWSKIADETLNSVIVSAKMNPETSFIFKTKPNESKKQIITLKKQNLPNCKIIEGGSSNKLIAEAYAVIGFNTTGLLEALILRKNVIQPKLHSLDKKKYINYCLDLNNLAFEPQNGKQLSKILNNILKNKKNFNIDEAKRVKLLKKHFLFLNEVSGEMLRKFITKSI